MNTEEKENAGSYEIIQSCNIGQKRFVIGYDPAQKDCYLIANHRARLDGLFSEYYECGVSDNYIEILGAYLQRQRDEYRALVQQRTALGSDGRPFTAADCLPITENDTLKDKILAIKPETLSHEYRIKEEQLVYALSGFGTEPKARGGKVFCRDCRDGSKFYVRREDVLGVLKPDKVPKWASKNVEKFRADEQQHKAQFKQKSKEREDR